MELNELILRIFDWECESFMKTDSYRLIEQKCSIKCLNQDERQLLNSEIHYVFPKLIKTLKEACPSLTKEDVIFCCLEKSGLDNSVICRCLGSICKKTIKQRKYRVKKKMQEVRFDFLFDLIFTT